MKSKTSQRNPTGRHGFTLLEVLLALALTSLLLLVLSMAIDFHLRVGERGRTDVEQGQLARVLLHRVAHDLRNVVMPAASDTDENSSGSRSMSDSGTDFETYDEFESLTGLNPADSVYTSGTPGLYGSYNWLQIDVGRMPRLDEYNNEGDGLVSDSGSFALGSSSTTLSSGIQTITYYVLAPGEGRMMDTEDGVEEEQGLVRRELDRAVTTWADEQGQSDLDRLQSEPIAPEVAAVEFQYFDGIEWVEEWNSETEGRLPSAVQVSLALWSADQDEDEPFDVLGTTDFQQLVDEGTCEIYRLVVHLPGAQNSDASTGDSVLEDTTSEESGDDGSGLDDSSGDDSSGGMSR